MAASASAALHDTVTKANLAAATSIHAKKEADADQLDAGTRSDQHRTADRFFDSLCCTSRAGLQVLTDLCSFAPILACEHMRLPMHLGLEEQQPRDQLQEALARSRVSRHKLTCRKKSVMAATADLLIPTVSAKRTRAKRSRPIASLENEGKGMVQRL